ncbi:MAG: hypothetical protein KF812_10105 [Fimbriimonadaceae bacterium]|nr:hypothetical protein [Fimbriimonadaceae bacterium]
MNSDAEILLAKRRQLWSELTRLGHDQQAIAQIQDEINNLTSQIDSIQNDRLEAVRLERESSSQLATVLEVIQDSLRYDGESRTSMTIAKAQDAASSAKETINVSERLKLENSDRLRKGLAQLEALGIQSRRDDTSPSQISQDRP